MKCVSPVFRALPRVTHVFRAAPRLVFLRHTQPTPSNV